MYISHTSHNSITWVSCEKWNCDIGQQQYICIPYFLFNLPKLWVVWNLMNMPPVQSMQKKKKSVVKEEKQFVILKLTVIRVWLYYQHVTIHLMKERVHVEDFCSCSLSLGVMFLECRIQCSLCHPLVEVFMMFACTVFGHPLHWALTVHVTVNWKWLIIWHCHKCICQIIIFYWAMQTKATVLLQHLKTTANQTSKSFSVWVNCYRSPQTYTLLVSGYVLILIQTCVWMSLNIEIFLLVSFVFCAGPNSGIFPWLKGNS